MATLRNIDPKAFVVDPGPLVQSIGNVTNDLIVRKAQTQVFDEGTSPAQKQDAFLRISKLNPGFAKVVLGLLEKRETLEITKIKDRVDEQGKMADFLLKQPNHAAKKKKLLALASEAAVNGEDPSELLRMASLSEDQLDVNLNRTLLQATDIETITKPNARAGQFEPVLDSQGNVVAQRNTATGKVVADPRVDTNQNQPLSTPGKLASDVKRGFITQEQADAEGVGGFEVGKANPKDFDPASLKDAQENNDISLLKPSKAALAALNKGGQFATGGMVMTQSPDGGINLITAVTNKRTGETQLNTKPISGSIVGRSTGLTPQQESALDVSTATRKKAGERGEVLRTEADIKSEAARGKGESERRSENILEAVSAAESIPQINRSLQLLNEVKTGGFDAVKLRAKQVLGIESGDEGELVFNLMTNVLKQLKPTFGSQFTEKEGKLLQDIEAGAKKGTVANIRLLRQGLRILQSRVDKGRRAAKRNKDVDALEDIDAALNLNLQTTDDSVPPVDPQSQTGRLVDQLNLRGPDAFNSGRFKVRVKQ